VEADVSDCFYNYTIKEIVDWFGVDEPMSVQELSGLGLDVSSVFDPSLGCNVPVTADTILYPCFEGLSMGWSWAIFFANESVSKDVEDAGGEKGSDVREKMPTPQLPDFRTISGTYVDNIAVIGSSPS